MTFQVRIQLSTLSSSGKIQEIARNRIPSTAGRASVSEEGTKPKLKLARSGVALSDMGGHASREGTPPRSIPFVPAYFPISFHLFSSPLKTVAPCFLCSFVLFDYVSILGSCLSRVMIMITSTVLLLCLLSPFLPVYLYSSLKNDPI